MISVFAAAKLTFSGHYSGSSFLYNNEAITDNWYCIVLTSSLLHYCILQYYCSNRYMLLRCYCIVAETLFCSMQVTHFVGQNALVRGSPETPYHIITVACELVTVIRALPILTAFWPGLFPTNRFASLHSADWNLVWQKVFFVFFFFLFNCRVN